MTFQMWQGAKLLDQLDLYLTCNSRRRREDEQGLLDITTMMSLWWQLGSLIRKTTSTRLAAHPHYFLQTCFFHTFFSDSFIPTLSSRSFLADPFLQTCSARHLLPYPFLRPFRPGPFLQTVSFRQFPQYPFALTLSSRPFHQCPFLHSFPP